ncbi:MAG TPA: FecR family protein [Dongiaceae bacterium]|nr:FecR family protein [Dongiaceae bacterium]
MACRVCVTAILGALTATPAFATGIATVTDVVNEGYRRPPGDQERRAAPSDELVSDEALRTKRDSSIAVKFIDGSELSVEAQSEVVLSDYVFDPQAATSTGIINLNVGLFHFNSNQIPDGGLTLKTPVATIGIRGTEFLVTVKDAATIVDILDGKVEVAPLGKGKPVTCEGGQSILVTTADSDAVCGDLGSFSTAAGESQTPSQGNTSGRDRPDHESGPSGSPGGNPGGNPGGGDPRGGDPGGGDPGGGDPGGNPGGNPGGGHTNHSGLGDGSNPGKGHDKGHGHGGNNGGSNNPGGSKH